MVFVLCDWLFPLSLTSLQWEDFQSPCRDPWTHIATPGCSPWNVWGGLSLQGPTRWRRSSGNCTRFEWLLCPRGVPLPSGLVFKFILPPRGTHLGGETEKGSPIPYPTCFCSVAQWCPGLCNPLDCSTPGLPVNHQLLEFTHTQCPFIQWCHPTSPSSVIPFSSCP